MTHYSLCLSSISPNAWRSSHKVDNILKHHYHEGTHSPKTAMAGPDICEIGTTTLSGVQPHYDTIGELPKNDERSDVESVGARFIAPAGWGGANALNSPTESVCSATAGSPACFGAKGQKEPNFQIRGI